MSSTSKSNSLITSGISYVLLAIIILVSTKFSLFRTFLVWFLMVFVLFVIRDMILFFGIEKHLHHRVFDWKLFFQDIKSGTLKKWDALCIVNREVVFPFFLISYIVLILLKQLDIFSLSTILTQYFFIEYGLLIFVSLSGFLTIWREKLDEVYYKSITSKVRTRLFIVMIIVLSLLAVSIIFRETASLGLLSIPISTISGILIYLIGILLLEEKEGDGEIGHNQ
ncbi:hypothetical protein KBD33_04785 [Candidatus Gracilibacteria bacterium]|nr:hypothetical protein [Candidatus Gracilibacteria bacterium]